MASKAKKKPVAKKAAPKKAAAKKAIPKNKKAAVKKVVKKTAVKSKPSAKKAVAKKPVAKGKPAKAKSAPKKAVAKRKAIKSKVVAKKAVKAKPVVKAKAKAVKPTKVTKVKPVKVAKPAVSAKAKKEEKLKASTSMIKHVEKPKEYTRRRTNPPIVKPAAPPRTTPLREDPVLPDAPVASILKKPVAMLDNRPTKLENSPDKTRYSDAELNEFRELIIQKLTDAKVELNNLQAFLNNSNEHGTDDTASSFKMLEDGSDTLAKEEAGQLAARQRKFIEQLENALVRIENKTYGLCRVTGKLIPKERLRAVPHTTQSIEAKVQQYRD